MTLFNDAEQQQITDAIAKAEKNTSGEIRICVEKNCKEEVLDRAAKYFYQLSMEKTKLRNGVLIYLATVDRKFAIIGDAGINKVVPADFWDCTKDEMLEQFKHGNLVEGIIAGITRAGEKLGTFFPGQPDDVNEISNDVAFMDGD
ncbi:TPM domain-containing protein [Mucilaginibacter auburnensis]|uniref:TLP183/Psb32/MOLO-1 phosphatase superfamily protein n=1 Tax=Mucilaginibacter auburnensis TaxID=1457233 RepID=A0A2H9VT87_9SPHI|nr:TPM domain-containing protein [Mucilaginibacter auburnensis]PJJ84014.1 TLP183/Psb32/MOLO-1 phosphatase superfamily protein [Mucilaginibacter auburnensis]